MRPGRVWAGICMILVACGLPFACAGPHSSAADAAVVPVTGTMQVSPTSVTAGQSTELTFTYTAAFLNDGTITLVVPTGWTPPSQAPGPGFITVSCANATIPARDCQLNVSAATGTITITNLFLITYEMASAPATATTSTFTATEQASPQGTLTGLAPSPTIDVNCPDGQGTMTGPANTVTAGTTVSLSFTYQAGSCGTGPGGEVTMAVPAGWTVPVTASGAAGSVTAAGGGGPPTTDGQTITMPAASLGPGATILIEYELARAPTGPGTYTFGAAEESSADDDLVALATSPEITVTPAGGSSSSSGQSSSPPPQAGLMTVNPARVLAGHLSTLTFTYTAPRTGLPASSELTVDVPAGWTAPSASASPGQPGYARSDHGVLSVEGRQLIVTDVALAGGQHLTLTYPGRAAPSAAGPSTFVASVRSGRAARLTALAVSPAVTVALTAAAGGAARWLVILLVIAVAIAAGVLVSRRVRRHGWTGPGPSVRTMPHPGAPASVVIHDTGKRPTLTVHIEPHASVISTTIRKVRL